MARTLNKLSDAKVKALTKRGRHGDGGGLYLNVSASGTKAWVFVWIPGKRPDGKPIWREAGLGPYPVVSLSNARMRAAACRLAVQDGRDPIAEKKQEREPTFSECADLYIASIRSEWRNAKHEYQWNQTLTAYCVPIRQKRVSEVDTAGVLGCLQPIWQAKNETASRLRGRIERVLDFAKVKGWRSGENPAMWRGHLKNILPKRQKLQRGHLAAMPYGEVPGFVGRLRSAEAMAAKALEFAILTVARSNEVLGARWNEIDLDKKLWNVPKERMKDGKTHTVPLSTRAVDLLRSLAETRQGDFVFPGEPRPGRKEDMVHGRPLSSMAMEMLLRRLKVTNATVHGFRSSFRDWAGDSTSFPREVAEAALAHKVGNEVERAYRRSDALEKRRKLMQAWADYLSAQKAGNVVQLRKK